MRQAVPYDGWGGTSEEIHFGLGDAPQVELVRVRWLSGKITELRNVAANQVLTVTEQPQPLEIQPAAGFVALPAAVTLVSRVDGRQVHYTLDGTEPTPATPAYTSPITLTTSTRVLARVFLDNVPASDTIGALYLENRWNDGIPVSWREQFFSPDWFNHTDAAVLADVDGDGVNNLQEWLAGTNPQDDTSRPTLPPALLTLEPPGGAFELSVTVRGNAPLPRTQIRYTLDGSEPNHTAPLLSQTGVVLTASTTIKARAFREGNPVSLVVAAVFNIRQVPSQIRWQSSIPSWVLLGSEVTIAVDVVGSPPRTYEWTFNDTALPGGTGPILTLPSVRLDQNGVYQVRVSNALGSVQSSRFNLRVVQPPEILRHPESQTVLVGTPITFTVEAIGTAPLSYEWYHDNLRIPTAWDRPVFTLPAAQKSDAGNYHVRVHNPYGVVNSHMARLSVTEQPELPKISVHPLGQTRLEGQDAVLSVSASGTRMINFNNRVPGASVDAPVFGEDGVTRLTGTAYLAQLYAGPAAEALAPVGWAVPFLTGEYAGYVAGGSVVVVPTVAPGAVAIVQMRVWESARGSSFESTLRTGSRVGTSAVLRIPTGGAGAPPSFPADMVGLTSFRLTRETEPPIIVISSPISGTTADDRFTLAGTVTDNVAVASAAWE